MATTPKTKLDGLTTNCSTGQYAEYILSDFDENRSRARARNLYLNRQRVQSTREREHLVSSQTEQTLSSLRDEADEATRDPFVWLTQHTKTYNEHWVEEGRPGPFEPFPTTPYFQDLFDIFEHERITWAEKSRDMMVSWGCIGFFTNNAMRVPYRGVVVQAQKEKKVIQLIDYAKCLYDQQEDWLKQAYPLVRPTKDQDSLSLEFKSGGYIVGIPGGADQIRSYHPWGYLNDESSFQPDAGECHNEALSAVKGKIVFNSSAGPGWYADARRDIIRQEEE